MFCSHPTHTHTSQCLNVAQIKHRSVLGGTLVLRIDLWPFSVSLATSLTKVEVLLRTHRFCCSEWKNVQSLSHFFLFFFFFFLTFCWRTSRQEPPPESLELFHCHWRSHVLIIVLSGYYACSAATPPFFSPLLSNIQTCIYRFDLMSSLRLYRTDVLFPSTCGPSGTEPRNCSALEINIFRVGVDSAWSLFKEVLLFPSRF